jgi:hypothetical protein
LPEFSKNPTVDVVEARVDVSSRDDPETYPVVSTPPASPSRIKTLDALPVLIASMQSVILLTQDGMLVKFRKDVLAAF